MPTTEYDGQVWKALTNLSCDLRSASNHRPRQYGDSYTDRIATLAQHLRSIICRYRSIDHSYRKPSLAQRGCERQKTQRRTQRRSVVRRIEQHHFASRQQLASSAGSSRFASTAGFMREVLLFSLLLSHNSTGAANTSWSRRQRAGIEIAF